MECLGIVHCMHLHSNVLSYVFGWIHSHSEWLLSLPSTPLSRRRLATPWLSRGVLKASQERARRYLDLPNPPETPSQKVLGAHSGSG